MDVETTQEAPEGPVLARAERHPGPREYVRIALILGVVTALEVGVYYAGIPGGLFIASLIFFSLIKFSLVVLWFMHLKFDSRTYARFFVMGLAMAATLYFVVLLSFRAFRS